MSQIFAIILAIAVAFSSVGGMTAALEEPVSFDAKISVDAEALLAMSGATGAPATEETEQTMKVVGDILGAITLKGVATSDAAELDLLAGEDVALSIGVKTGESGTTVASSLLSSDVIFISPEVMEQYRQQMMSAVSAQSSGMDMNGMAALQTLDKEQIAKDAAEVGEKLIQAFEAKKGETETGEFTVDDMTFTAKTPVNMTYAELVELLLTSTKELTAKESLKPLFEMSGKDMGAEIDKALEELKNQPESDHPEMELAVYTNAENAAYYVCNMKKAPAAEGGEEEKIYFAFGEVDGLNRCSVNMDANGKKMNLVYNATKEGALEMNGTIEDNGTNAEITAKQDEAGNLDMVADIKAQGTDAKIVVKSETAEGDRKNFTLELYMGGAGQPMMTFTGSAGKGGEIVSAFEGEDLNVIPIEQLMDENDQTVASQLQMKLIAGLMKGIVVVSKNVPEETATWINTQIKQMMSPGTTKTESK